MSHNKAKSITTNSQVLTNMNSTVTLIYYVHFITSQCLKVPDILKLSKTHNKLIYKKQINT